ncbi:F-box/LRR-repeat protein, partial [Trifolium pratense]
MNRETKQNDRLSNLSDSIILHILSFLNTKQAFQTRILSTRWKNLTKLLPVLRLSSLDFKPHHNLGNLVSRVLSLRDHSTTLHTVEFTDITDFVEPNILKRIVEYAVSHDIQLLRISITCKLQQFPPCLFSSQTLTSLDLCVHPDTLNCKIFPNALKFPAVTTLTLRSFHFCAGDDGCAEPFSAFSKLITLTIQDCKLLIAQVLCISSFTLVNLTVDEIAFYDDSYDYAFLLDLLLELGNIKSLTISYSTLEVLSLVPDLWNVKINSLYNLESLQIKRYRPSTPLYVYGGLNRTTEPAKVVYFLLQNSPLAKERSWYSIAEICTTIKPLWRKIVAGHQVVASSLAHHSICRSVPHVTLFCVNNRVLLEDWPLLNILQKILVIHPPGDANGEDARLGLK